MSIGRTAMTLAASATVVFLLSVFSSQQALLAEEKTSPWWETETAMGNGGLLKLDKKPWWNRAQALAVGEHFVVKSAQPGGEAMLIRREAWKSGRKMLEAIVWVIDDDGDFRPSDKDGDKDSDCYVVDYDGDGKVDRIVDYIDNDGDGISDEMDIRYFVNGRLRRAWFGMDLDNDGFMWNVKQYEYRSNFFRCDPYGSNMVYFNGYDAELDRWFPASECPFAFHDTDGDGQSEAVVRVSAVPLSYKPEKKTVDCANDVNYSSAPRTEATREMGALNIRYSIDIDNLSCEKRPLHYDLGFNLIGRVPYKFKGMNHKNPLRRAPKTTVVIPHNASRKMAENYPAEQTGFSWREFWDDSRTLGYGPLAVEDRRWEGLFWTWSRRVMHNTGGPTQTWNMRREFCGTPSIRRELYYSHVDRRIHLKGASEGWIRVGHFGDSKPLGEVRFFDTDADGYFDRWEVYREGQAAPVRVSSVRNPRAKDMPADWDKLSAFYTKELLPEAICANKAIMAAMRAVDPRFIVPDNLQKALNSATDDTERRYIQDIIRECQYQHLREGLLEASGNMMKNQSRKDRKLYPSTASYHGWKTSVLLSQLDAAYGEGRFEDAVEILKTIQKENTKTSGPSQGIWYTAGIADRYGRSRPDKSYPSEKYARVYPGKTTVYSGPMATYCAWHRPMAVYSPSQDKTFFVFGNPKNSPTISFYDHRTKAFSVPVVLGTNPNKDAHRNPTLLIDEQGYLYVFYGAHGHPSHVVKSVSPFDISRWHKMPDIPDKNTYPQPWQLMPGEIFVSYRGSSKDWRYRRSVDGAATWQSPVQLIHFGATYPYAVSVAETGDYPRKIHMAWERMGGGTPEEIRTKALWARRYNVYYAYSDDGGRKWRRSDGSLYKLPITEETAEKIYDSGEHGVWLKDIQLDPDGNPYVLFIDADLETYQCQWKVAQHGTNGWHISDVAVSDHMYDAGALLILSADDIRVYAPTKATQDHEDGGEIEEWRSCDGGSTWKNTRQITSGSKLSHNHVKTVFNQKRDDFHMMWNYGDSMYPPSTKNVYLYRYGDALDSPVQMRFPASFQKAIFVDRENKSQKNDAETVVALDRYYNNERRNGKPYHYAWEYTGNGGYSKLRDLIKSLGAKTLSITGPATRQSLANVDIYMIVDPDTPKETPVPNYIGDDDVEAIVEWVKAGGVLMLLGNNQGESEFEHLNGLANRFGITFNENNILGVNADPEKLRKQLHSLPDHPFFKGAKKLHMRSICTLSVKPPAEAVYSLDGDCIMVLSRYGKGIVFALGDPWGYNEYINYADNPQCLKNTFDWLIERAKQGKE